MLYIERTNLSLSQMKAKEIIDILYKKLTNNVPLFPAQLKNLYYRQLLNFEDQRYI